MARNDGGNATSPSKTTEPAPSTRDTGSAEVQEKVDAEQERGFRGVEVDPTPNENYTVAGVTSGAPTPETDLAAAEEARKAQADAANKATGVGER
jgi:hypothetical protein